MKCPPCSLGTSGQKLGSDYYNHKGFFFLVLLVLVDAGGSSGSSSDAHMFNGSDFTLFPAGRRCLSLDAMDGETLQQKTTHKRKNSKLQDRQRQEGGGECN